ncbi:MAG: hypothetical protein R2815_09175 [Flavobacteriales bacterium]|nr:hypothetical protein [Flavobacteriales bacterium]
MKTLSGLCLCLFLFACGGQQNGDHEGTTKDTLAADPEPNAVEMVNIGGKLFNVPSPAQTAIAIRKAGLKYQKDLTAPLEKGETVTGKLAQSMALGVYGADLAYVTVHKDGQRALATMQAIEKLGGKLEVTNAFDRALIERFKSNMGNEDSLLQFSGRAFRAADQYLKNNKRDDVSALVLAGGWIESLHLTLSDPAAMNDQALVSRIGEQKNTLNGLVDLIEATDQDKSAVQVLKAMKELQAHFAGVTSTYTYEKPVTEPAKKTTFINSTSSVSISPESLAAIVSTVSSIRSMILA